MELTEIAKETLKNRYYLRDSEGNIIETAEDLFNRVATHVASAEVYDEAVWRDKFYKRMVNLEFLPNTPTLMNAGKEKGQLSACFVLPIEDSMEGIFSTLKDAAVVHQTGGGTGFDFSKLRPEGAMVSNKSGVSTGPLAFCQVYDKATEVIKQGATRRGANMMNLRVDHPDIEKFIDMKTKKGTMENFNVSVTITDEFMDALENDRTYELKHSTTGVVKEISATYIWDKIATNAWKSAEPGIIFIDRVNKYSPYKEKIEATNPCGEQPLPPYGSCNLGSINISKFITNGSINRYELKQCVEDSVRFLDNVISVNSYPTSNLARHAKKYRNIGLGIMGWADALIMLDISYDSQRAIDLAQEIMKFINVVAHKYSVYLVKDKGIPTGAPFKKVFNYSSEYRRNATLTTVAPTGTISMIAGCSSGIEPVFAFEMIRHQMDTVLVDYHPLYQKAKNNGGANREIFIDAHSVSPTGHVDMQAAFQEHCDSAISKTINLPESINVSDVKMVYRRAWETGCKGITIYRNGSREGVLHHKDEPKVTEKGYCLECGGELIIESGCEKCISCGLSKCLIS